MDDVGLVQLAVAGDREAFAAIYDRYAPRLHDFLASVLHDRDEAADVLHETFLLAGSRIHQLRDPARLRAWLWAIGRNLALRDMKRRSRTQPLDDIDVAARGPDGADVAAQGELASLVRDASAGLAPRDRVLLDLHLRQGLEGKELADVLGVSPSHAYVLVSRLRDQIGRSLGVLLVARQGRSECAELAALLDGWDGRLTTVWRKRVGRHVDGCVVCSERRQRSLSPAALLGVLPALGLPADVRRRVLDEVELCSNRGRPWPPSRDGFPFPVDREPRVRWRRKALLAAVVVLVLGAIGLTAVSRDRSTTLVGVGPDPTGVTQRGVTSTSTSGPAGAPAASTTTVATGPAAPPGSDGDVPPTLPTVPPSTSPPSSKPSSPSTSPPAGDRDPPTLRTPHVDPSEVWAAGKCPSSPKPRPRTAVVTIVASDASGLGDVTLSLRGPQPGSLRMTLSGPDRYDATVGPFSEVGIPVDGSVTVPFTVQATDRAGNVASAGGSFVVHCGG